MKNVLAQFYKELKSDSSFFNDFKTKLFLKLHENQNVYKQNLVLEKKKQVSLGF